MYLDYIFLVRTYKVATFIVLYLREYDFEKEEKIPSCLEEISGISSGI